MTEEEIGLRQARRIVLWATIVIIVTSSVIGCFTIGTTQRNNEQSNRSNNSEKLARVAAIKSAKAVTRTTALSQEQEHIRELAIKNCEREKFYLASSAIIREQSAINADNFNANTMNLSKEFANRPGFANISKVFAARAVLDRARAHIARASESDLSTLSHISCSLNLPVDGK